MEVREALGLVDAAASVGVTEPTWFGLEGHPKCCDHIWVAAAARSGILVAGVEPDSISECEREDHKMVWCKLDGMLAPLGPRPEPSLKLDRGLLADERATAAFRHALREARHGVLASASKGPDAMHAEVVSCVGRLQQEHFFSRQPSAPTKPWISAATWDLVKRTPARRNAAIAAAFEHKRLLLAVVLLAWSAAAPQPSIPALSPRSCGLSMEQGGVRSPRGSTGTTGTTPSCQPGQRLRGPSWQAVAMREAAVGQQLLPVSALRAAAARWRFQRHRGEVRGASRADRQSWADDLAQRADAADAMGDTRELYQVTRELRAPRGARGHASVLHENGSVLVDHDQILQRWGRHWAHLFAGELVPLQKLSEAPPFLRLLQGRAHQA